MRIGSKAEYYRLMEQGVLGNTLRNWRTAHEAIASGVDLFGLREIGAAGGGSHFICGREHLEELLVVHGPKRFLIDEAAPDTDVILQGEICRTFRGLEGVLGVRTGHRMRESSRLGLLRPVRGLIAKLLLDEFLDPSSRDDVEALLTRYPDATIELASYPYNLGKIPNRNTVIWEVRDY